MAHSLPIRRQPFYPASKKCNQEKKMQTLHRCFHYLKFALFLFPLLVNGLTVHSLLAPPESTAAPPLQVEARLVVLPDGEITAVSPANTFPTLPFWLTNFWQQAGLWLLLLAGGFVMMGLLLKTPRQLQPTPIPKQAYDH